MLLENFTATLNKLMCYNENYQKHIHTFLVYFITIFLIENPHITGIGDA